MQRVLSLALNTQINHPITYLAWSRFKDISTYIFLWSIHWYDLLKVGIEVIRLVAWGHWNNFQGNIGETFERCGRAHTNYSEHLDTIWHNKWIDVTAYCSTLSHSTWSDASIIYTCILRNKTELHQCINITSVCTHFVLNRAALTAMDAASNRLPPHSSNWWRPRNQQKQLIQSWQSPDQCNGINRESTHLHVMLFIKLGSRI